MHAVSQWEALCAFLECEVILDLLFPPQASRLFGDMREGGNYWKSVCLVVKESLSKWCNLAGVGAGCADQHSGTTR